MSIFLTEEEYSKKHLIAFSGGPDSVYLLVRLAEQYKYDLKDHVFLCYINYHDSQYVDQEEKIVREYIEKYKITAFIDNINLPETNVNFEEWARDYRYHLFSRLIKENGLDDVLTAHQENDHIETYLLQLKRHNLPLQYGLRRETEMCGSKLIRPILDVKRTDILNYLKENGYVYYDDITNRNLERQRNALRTKISESDFDSILAEIDTKNSELKKLYSSFNTKGSDFDFYEKLTEDEKRRYCFFILDSNGIKEGREGIGKRMYDFLKTRRNDSLEINNLRLYKTSKEFFLSIPFENLQYEYEVDKPSTLTNRYFTVDLSNPSIFHIKGFPIIIRNFHIGDRLSSGFPIKDVEEFLKKQDVPSYLFPLYPVFVYNGEVFFVPMLSDIKKKKIPFRLNYQRGLL